MSRFPLLAVVLAIVATGCGSDSPAVTPPTTLAPPTRIVMTATLSPSQEVPPIVSPNAEAAGSGTVSAVMNMTRDGSGNITAATVEFTVTVTGFPGGTVFSLAHIHEGIQGCQCPVVVNTAISSGEWSAPNGSGTFTKTATVSPVDVANRIFNNPSGFYFNVHTPLNPGGVARGQLSRTQ